MANQYVIISEPLEIAARGAGVFYRILAHELGHTLLLSHGDGLPKGGTLPPQAGLRKFDQDCGGGQSTVLS
ncbi:MAG: hypothetical protein ACREBG_23780 [Pyrinomonadaceae bacterium]